MEGVEHWLVSWVWGLLQKGGTREGQSGRKWMREFGETLEVATSKLALSWKELPVLWVARMGRFFDRLPTRTNAPTWELLQQLRLHSVVPRERNESRTMSCLLTCWA